MAILDSQNGFMQRICAKIREKYVFPFAWFSSAFFALRLFLKTNLKTPWREMGSSGISVTYPGSVRANPAIGHIS